MTEHIAEPEMVDVNCVETPFQMSKYLVTQELYRSIMGENPSYFKGTLLPVERVSWYNAQVFIQKLNNVTGKTYALPTEYQWMMAAMVDNTIYSGSDDIEDVAWYYRNSDNKTHPVGGKKPNSLGLYDMTGNVWEWCRDSIQVYDKSRRVLRGGSWLSDERICRCPFRYDYDPGSRDDDIGFRLVLPK